MQTTVHTTVRLAVAGALALAAGNALALSPSEITTAYGNGTLVTLYVSGATATDNALENLFKLDDTTYRVCQPGTLDIYYYKSSSGSISQRALTCTAAFSGDNVTSGTTKLALLKESAGGSANGITYPAAGTALNFIDLVGGSSNFASACGTVTTSTGTTLPSATSTFNTRDCGHVASSSASTVTRSSFVPTAGISDIDPASFVGTGGVTASHNSALTRKRASVAVTFNPIVSVPLFTALQRAYGYIGDTASENTDSLSFVPSLPSSVIRAIYNGNSVLAASEVNINGVKLNTKLSGFADSSGDIYVCRRGDTSGTMTSFKIHFLGQGCNKNTVNNISFVEPDTSSCTASGCTWSSTYYNDYVFAASGSSDVRNCINYHSGQGRLAVGVASTEAKPDFGSTATSNRYRYIKVDGAEPTLKAVMEGRYSFFTENTFNDRYSNDTASTTVTGAQTLWDKLYSSVGNSTALSELNRPWRNSVANVDEGDTGILDSASSGNASAINTLFSDGAITVTEVRATPLNSQTRQTLTGTANNCNLPYQAYP